MDKTDFEILRKYSYNLIQTYEHLVEKKGTEAEDMSELNEVIMNVDREPLDFEYSETEIEYTSLCSKLERIIVDIKSVELSKESMKLLIEINLRKRVTEKDEMSKRDSNLPQAKDCQDYHNSRGHNEQEKLKSTANSKIKDTDNFRETFSFPSDDESSSDNHSVISKSELTAQEEVFDFLDVKHVQETYANPTSSNEPQVIPTPIEIPSPSTVPHKEPSSPHNPFTKNSPPSQDTTSNQSCIKPTTTKTTTTNPSTCSNPFLNRKESG